MHKWVVLPQIWVQNSATVYLETYQTIFEGFLKNGFDTDWVSFSDENWILQKVFLWINGLFYLTFGPKAV